MGGTNALARAPRGHIGDFFENFCACPELRLTGAGGSVCGCVGILLVWRDAAGLGLPVS